MCGIMGDALMGGWGHRFSVGEAHVVARKVLEVCFEKLVIKRSENSRIADATKSAFLGMYG